MKLPWLPGRAIGRESILALTAGNGPWSFSCHDRWRSAIRIGELPFWSGVMTPSLRDTGSGARCVSLREGVRQAAAAGRFRPWQHHTAPSVAGYGSRRMDCTRSYRRSGSLVRGCAFSPQGIQASIGSGARRVLHRRCPGDSHGAYREGPAWLLSLTWGPRDTTGMTRSKGVGDLPRSTGHPLLIKALTEA